MAILDADGVNARPVSIAIAIPSHEHAPVQFAMDLGLMMSYTSSLLPEEVSIGISMCVNTYIHKARQELLESLLDSNITHILWLDSDMSFPPETLVQLMSRDVDFVGVNYSQRSNPPGFVGIKRGGWHQSGEIGQALETNEESTGLESCDALGFGAFLMRTDALSALPEGDPWFWYERANGYHMGEDVYFCRLLQTLGHTIYCDHDLSKECAHIGSFQFRTSHAEAYARAMKED